MQFNKKAQIGETMTWMLATFAIIGMLLLSMFITKAISFSSKSSLSSTILAERQEDVIATKSLSAFLNDNSNLAMIKSYDKNQTALENSLTPFLSSLSGIVNSSPNNGWNFRIYLNDKKTPEFEVITYSIIGWYDRYDVFFKFKKEDGEIKLRLWQEFQS